jgi:hypothetical protein
VLCCCKSVRDGLCWLLPDKVPCPNLALVWLQIDWLGQKAQIDAAKAAGA